MSESAVVRYVVSSSAVAVASGAVLLPLLLVRGPLAVRLGLLGWFAMAAIGVVGGTWLVARHGRAGSGFMLALGACMLARFAVVGLGSVVAALWGNEGIWPYVGGLVAGFVPMQVFESIWFAARTRRVAAGSGAALASWQERRGLGR